MFFCRLKKSPVVCKVASMVKAQSRSEEALSRQIAMAIKALSEGRRPETINP